MTKRIEAKYKIDRRYGVNLWGRPKSPVNLREYRPGQHGQKGQQGKPSNHALQLAAKQKLRGYHGFIGERQFRRLYAEASRRTGDTGENLIELLERRLDTVVYRLKWVSTIFAARQFVNHGHVQVNGRRVNIPSYQVRDGDVISIKEGSRELSVVIEAQALAERDVPDYIEADAKHKKGTFLRRPALSDVPYPIRMEPHLIVEWYSRRI